MNYWPNRWRTPRPVTHLVLDWDSRVLVVDGPGGQVTHEAKTIAFTEHLDLDHPDVPAAIERVICEIERTLRDAGRVADPAAWELSVQVNARLKTWPAIPGVTSPPEVPMPGDAS